jgi:acetyl/propionyl-CoA carboxylase alpha subunit
VGPLMAEVRPGATPGEVIVRDGDRVARLYAVVDGGTAWVFHDGVTYEVVESRSTRVRSTAAGESLTAPMPATVVQVKVAPGDTVTRGDILIVLEAMKMELPVRATTDGRVVAIHCEPGQLVQPDTSLIELGLREPQTDAGQGPGIA